MPQTPPRNSSSVLSPGRRVFLEPSGETETRASRRQQGQALEFGLLPQGSRTSRTNATMPSQLQQTDPAIAPRIVYVPVTPRSVTPFCADGLDDVEDWVQHYERVARLNGWTPDQYLQNLYFSLDATAKYWFENPEESLTSWEICKSELLRTFANQHRQQHAEDLLHVRIQAPTESVRSFVEDVLRLSARADPRATEEKKVQALMRGIRNDIFGGLVRNPPTAVAEFVAEVLTSSMHWRQEPVTFGD
ncbi:hypothetical protein V5799_019969 [Amblyomma americanum]|uniref:Retrotransposon gag domain-containing protein n=1 Tax=Amblyomma americanum TaxID=6943 RepID=A0AAQ4EV77_AMBAM